MKQESSIHFTKTKIIEGEETTSEEWLLSPDVRHGKAGFRARRYLPSVRTSYDIAKEVKKVMDWDENYMFFETLDAAFRAFQLGNLEEARKAF